MRWRWVRERVAALALAVVGCAAAPAVAGAELPAGFSDREAIDGLKRPTSVAFSSDGRVFVTEKRGLLVSLKGIGDETPRTIADLRTQVHDVGDRGLLSLALDPDFPRRPFIYVGYTYDAPLGLTAPVWGGPDGEIDACPPGNGGSPDYPGCAVSSRVSRLKLGPNGLVRRERTLVSDWCQQFLSHSIGDLAFDRQGALLVGGGEGASYLQADTRAVGDHDVCGDPPVEGGALRAQDVLTTGDPLGLGGTVARIDPASGEPASPASAPGNDGRIMSFGLRNPFRFALRPGTDELYVADVGWTDYEEINVATVGRRENFGWPCFGGPVPEPAYVAAGTPLCQSLYADPGAVTSPWFSYLHEAPVVDGEPCPPGDGGSAIAAIAFDRGRNFPAPFDDALVFADYVRNCIWAISPGRFGKPRRSTISVLESDAQYPIDIVNGPGGLYYVDPIGQAIRRIAYDLPTVEVGLRTRPAGLAVRLDERTELGGAKVTVKRGSELTLGASGRQRRGGMTFAFERWSDRGSRSHEVRASGDRTYTAIYSCRRGCGEAGWQPLPRRPRK